MGFRPRFKKKAEQQDTQAQPDASLTGDRTTKVVTGGSGTRFGFLKSRPSKRAFAFMTVGIIVLTIGSITYWKLFLDGSRTVVTVGGQDITQNNINERKDALGGANKFFGANISGSDAAKQAEDSLIMYTALKQEADARGMSVTDTEMDRMFAENANRHKTSLETFEKTMLDTYGFTREDLEMNYTIQILQTKLQRELLQSRDILRVTVRYDMFEGEPTEKADIAAAERILKEKFLPLFSAKAPTSDIIAKTDRNAQSEFGQAKTKYPTIGVIDVGLNQTAKPDYFQDQSEWEVVNGFKQAGDYTDKVMKSSGGYFYLYRLESKTAGEYASWQDFLEKTKQKVTYHQSTPSIGRAVASTMSYLFGRADAFGTCSVDLGAVKQDGKLTALVKRVFGLEQVSAQSCSGTTTNHLTGWAGNVSTTGGVSPVGTRVDIMPRPGWPREGWQYCGGKTTDTVYTGGWSGGFYDTGQSFSCFMQWKARYTKANCNPAERDLPLIEGDNGKYATMDADITLTCQAPPPPPPTDRPYCASVGYSKRSGPKEAYTVHWSFGGIGNPKNGAYDATLYGSASQNTVNNVGTSGSRPVNVGSGSWYTITLYDGYTNTGVTCVTYIIPNDNPPPPDEQDPCENWDYYGMGICCDTNPHPVYCREPPLPDPDPVVRCDISIDQSFNTVRAGTDYTIRWDSYWWQTNAQGLYGRKTGEFSGYATLTYQEMYQQIGKPMVTQTTIESTPGSKTFTAPRWEELEALDLVREQDSYRVQFILTPANPAAGRCIYDVFIHDPGLTLPECTTYAYAGRRTIFGFDHSVGYKSGSYATRPRKIEVTFTIKQDTGGTTPLKATVNYDVRGTRNYQSEWDWSRRRTLPIVKGLPYGLGGIPPMPQTEVPADTEYRLTLPNPRDIHVQSDNVVQWSLPATGMGDGTISDRDLNRMLYESDIENVQWRVYGVLPGDAVMTCGDTPRQDPPPPADETTGPYHKVYGGDVSVGGGFGEACTIQNDATILAFNKEVGDNHVGAGTQLAAYALGVINGFGTSQARTPTSRKQLTFANTITGTGNDFGGKLNQRHVACIPDYWAGSSRATEKAVLAIDQENKGVFKVTSDQVILGGRTIGTNQQLTLYVEGDVRIKDNITYDTDNYSNLASIPSFRLIVKGNIYVDPSVTELSGVYVAMPKEDGTKGLFYTCGSGGFSPPSFNQLKNNCTNLLTVYGAVVADTIKLTRSRGNVDKANVNERYNNNDGEPAEKFIYTPELWLTSDFGGTGENDSFGALPPVL